MAARINVGIDLGTTNSAIARWNDQQVEIIRNPAGLRQLLPSVVAFRGGRTLIGDKARELMKKDPSRVLSAFKRKMGTTHRFHVAEAGEFSPEDLSAMVLQELKHFLPAAEQPEAAVITIPASFDTVQSQATLRAGKQAGFTEVKLLQEPIAASLAYANQGSEEWLQSGQWLVYDLGGGTFDVALVRIEDEEMKVVDHEGDNFLGGTDLDLAIATRILVPALEAAGQFTDLEAELRRQQGRHPGLLAKLMLLAEEAKIELSTREDTEVELSAQDDDGKDLDLYLALKRSDLEPLLEGMLTRTIRMVQEMLQRNEVQAADLKAILLVGGTTYLPQVREELSRELGVAVRTEVDPTTAVVVGAAHYASTQVRKSPEPTAKADIPAEAAPGLNARFGYQKATQATEEYLVGEVEGAPTGAMYRIHRLDGGFDTGLLPLEGKIKHYLPLLPKVNNEFQLRIFDANQEELSGHWPLISIAQGNYAVLGQPLPQDICLEVDDLGEGSTRLEVVFAKNTLLPVRKTITRQLSRSIAKGADDALTIRVLEGPGTALPAATLPIGVIRLSGHDLERELVRGSDVEITLEMSESRQLRVEAYLVMTGQSFEEVFTTEQRQVSLPYLQQEIRRLLGELRVQLQDVEARDQFELARSLTDLEYELQDLRDQVMVLTEDDQTDARYQLEDRKRKLAGEIYRLTREQQLIRVQEAYFEEKRRLEQAIEAYGSDAEDEKAVKELLAEEKPTLASKNRQRIRSYTERLQQMSWRIRWHNDNYVLTLFLDLARMPLGQYRDRQRVEALLAEGQAAYDEKDAQRLRAVINRLFDLLPKRQQQGGFLGTGLQ